MKGSGLHTKVMQNLAALLWLFLCKVIQMTEEKREREIGWWRRGKGNIQLFQFDILLQRAFGRMFLEGM